jgi:hypothetical protein
MEYVGYVHKGRIQLTGGVNLPEGVQVIVKLVDEDDDVAQGVTGAELLAAKFIGVWAGRDDMGDTAEFADELRRKSEHRN